MICSGEIHGAIESPSGPRHGLPGPRVERHRCSGRQEQIKTFPELDRAPSTPWIDSCPIGHSAAIGSPLGWLNAHLPCQAPKSAQTLAAGEGGTPRWRNRPSHGQNMESCHSRSACINMIPAAGTDSIPSRLIQRRAGRSRSGQDRHQLGGIRYRSTRCLPPSALGRVPPGGEDRTNGPAREDRRDNHVVSDVSEGFSELVSGSSRDSGPRTPSSSDAPRTDRIAIASQGRWAGPRARLAQRQTRRSNRPIPAG